MIKFRRKSFEIFVYCMVIITGANAILFHFTQNNTLGWILVTLGVLNLGATLLRKNK
jgi:hypothetical protein